MIDRHTLEGWRCLSIENRFSIIDTSILLWCGFQFSPKLHWCDIIIAREQKYVQRRERMIKNKEVDDEGEEVHQCYNAIIMSECTNKVQENLYKCVRKKYGRRIGSSHYWRVMHVQLSLLILPSCLHTFCLKCIEKLKNHRYTADTHAHQQG